MRSLLLLPLLVACAPTEPVVAPCDVSGVVCTVAGQGGVLGMNADGLAASETWFYYPSSLAWAHDGTLIIDDFNNMRIRELRDGNVSTIVGNGVHGWAVPGAPKLQTALENPVDVAVGPDGTLYVAELHTNRILSVGDDGLIQVFAGTGDEGFGGDGSDATLAYLNAASGVAVAPDGRVYIADTNNHCVREVGLDGVIRNIAGDGLAGTELGPSARFDHPQHLAVDGSRLLIADAYNNQVRAIALDTHQVTVLAGTGAAASDGDGGPAIQAALHQPYGVAVDDDGAVYVSELLGNRVRRIGVDGTIETVAGTGEGAFAGDEGPAVDAALNGPADVLIGPDGAVWIADMFNGVVRRIAP